jgi:drug/metabolite transporter (DMT)-like permease
MTGRATEVGPSEEGASASRSDARVGLIYVTLGTVLFSTSSVLVRWAAPLSPFEIGFWRMVVAAATVWFIARLRGEAISLHRADLPRFAVFGLVAALHFVCYIASLSFTTVAHSLALVYTSPIFVTLFAAIFLHEPVTRRKWLGILVAVLGVAVLAGMEPTLNWRMVVGDLLALASAVWFGFYSVIGRAQRERYPLLTYATGVYAVAACWILPAAALTFTGAVSGVAVVALLAMGIFPLGIGHTLYNAALRRLHPTIVNLVATQEVTGGVILALLLLGEAPSLNALVGAAITLAGIAMVLF